MEYRICWAASSNASFRGCGEWEENDGSREEIEAMLEEGKAAISEGLSRAIEESGFEWWIESREREAGDRG